ncbi:hypothetical protein BJ085DRAFT_2528, partial [Dimargaris cristalligena]
LVPIRIELESDGHRLRDTFTWNLNDTLISHELFAETLCEDLQLPSTLFVPGMVKQMKEQIADYQGHSYLSQAETTNDLRVVIRIDITVGNVALMDQFEWDGCQDPEHFAASFCADLGLSGEFLTAVAHSIREQLFIYTKSLLLLGYPFDGSLVEDLDLQGAFLPPISTVVRSSREVNEFTPSLVELSALELERKEKDDDRDIRRKRRQTRGR